MLSTSSYPASTGRGGAAARSPAAEPFAVPAPPPLAKPSTRDSRLLKSCSFRKAARTSASGLSNAASLRAIGTGASSFSRTRSRDIRAIPACSTRLSRRFGCLISSARSSNSSRLPKVLMSSAAVLMPMPGTPGTLSVESPARACTSTTFSGGTPKRSTTSSPAMRFCFMGSRMVTPGRTSCIRSLSEETISTSIPASSACLA